MRSANVDTFNHDNEATNYDSDVSNASDPIRTAYQDALRWVIKEAQITPAARVLELGSGTGNLSQLITNCGELVAVDVSQRMEMVAKSKIDHLGNRRFIKADLLEVFSEHLGRFHNVISTYAVHHLIDSEKEQLFRLVFDCLLPGGRAVFGDLMIQNSDQKEAKIQQYLLAGDRNTAQAISEEFFWSIDLATIQLERLGFLVRIVRFSDLSFGIVAEKAKVLVEP